ncbi:ComEC/Rec2 family competence protein [Patescibacteria group bacterium]
MKFYTSIIAFTLAIFLSSFFAIDRYFAIFIIFLGFVLFLYFYVRFGNSAKTREGFGGIMLIAVFLIALGSGFLRFSLLDDSTQNAFDHLLGEKITVDVLVVEEPDIRENNTRLTAEIKGFYEKDRFSGIDSVVKVLVVGNHYPAFKYGDKLKISGKLQKPKNFKNENGREFDYISYLAKDEIYYQIFYPKTEFISSGNGNLIKEKLFAVKNSFLGNIKKVIPDPHASLLGGLVVGAKESLGSELQEDFRRTGLIHIVVLSGYNLSIVAEFVMRIFSFLPRFLGMSFGALSIILFAVMTGASATIVRASIMALLVILARLTGRTNDIVRSLMLAGFFMVLHNPKILVFDPSFQLSFMATFGLVVLAPQVEKVFHFLPSKFQIREAAVATISTQIFVLPLLLYMMGELSLVALPVNLLVLIFIPLTMLFGFLAGVVGFVSIILSLPFAYVTYFLLSYELKIVEIFSSLPFASVVISYFPFWVMVSVYIFYVLIFFSLSSTTSQFKLGKNASI